MDRAQIDQDLQALQAISKRLEQCLSDLTEDDLAQLAALLGVFQPSPSRQESEDEHERLVLENRRQKALLDSIFETDPAGLAVVARPDLRCVYVNTAYRFMVPHPEINPLGQPYDQVWAAEPEAAYLPQLEQTLKTGTPFLLNGVERVFLGGETRSFTFHIRRIDWDGQPAALLILWDTTEIKQANERVLTILESLTDGFTAWDRQWRYTYVNTAAERLLGLSRENMLGRDARRLFPEAALFFRRYEQAMAEQTTMTFEDYYAPLGVWVEVRAYPSADGLSMFFRDITERKHAEEQLRQQSHLIELSYEPIFTWDLDGGILSWNAGCERLYGYGREEAIGHSSHELLRTQHPVPLEAIHQELLAQGSWSGELRQTTKDGREVTIETRHQLMESDGRRVVLETNHDITARKQAAAELQAKTAEIQSMTQQLWQSAKLATMGELSASIAHELNNPLAILSLRLEDLSSRIGEDVPEQKDLRIMSQEIERMSNLISNLLQFSRSGKRQISSLDIREEIDRTLDLVHNHLVHHRISVERAYSGDTPVVHADRQQIRQLFLNLFTNASDAMPEGGTLTIRVEPEDGPPAVSIEVQDSGVGIASGLLPNVMEPFFTTKSEGKGTGLGLGICKRIVEEYHGTIEITSPGRGQGATVHIRLPSSNPNPPLFLDETDEA